MPLPSHLEYVGVGYAASGRACCKGCKEEMKKGSLRINTSMHEFNNAFWHPRCFFGKYKTIEKLSEFGGHDQLKPADRERLTNQIEKNYTPPRASSTPSYGNSFGVVAPIQSTAHSSNKYDFKIEYAKSGRSKCTTCHDNIDQGLLRFARMEPSPFFDGRVPKWSHYDCFFRRPVYCTSTTQIDGFHTIRWVDQQMTCRKLNLPVPEAAEEGGEDAGAADAGAAGEGGAADDQGGAGPAPTDDARPQPMETEEPASAAPKGPPPALTVDCAAHNRSSCKKCAKKIDKGEVRVGREEPKGKSTTTGWYHRDCFMSNSAELANGADITPDILKGFGDLPADEQGKFGLESRKRPAEEQRPDGAAAKKARTAPPTLKMQSQKVWKIRDALQQALLSTEIRELLKHNGMDSTGGQSDILDRLTDAMLFGVPLNHEECGGALKFTEEGYVCTGQASEWARCDYKTRTPKRKVFVMLDDGWDESVPDVLKKLQYEVADRLFAGAPTAPASKTEAPADGGDPTKPLGAFKVFIAGTGFKRGPNYKVQEALRALGAGVCTSITANTNLCLAANSAVWSWTPDPRVVAAANRKIPIVKEEFLDEAEKAQKAPNVFDFIAYDPTPKQVVAPPPAPSIHDTKFASVIVKGRAAVEPQSGLAEMYHVFEDGDEVYSATLGLVDVAKDINSFYKLQVLQHDKHARQFRLVRAWGRVGTGVGSCKVDDVGGQKKAVQHFLNVFEEKTGMTWDQRSSGTKVPGKFFPIELALKSKAAAPAGDVSAYPIGSRSKLDPRVVDLLKALLDVKAMQRAMLSCDIDLNKMPLGQLSEAQISSAYGVLADLQRQLQAGAPRKTDIVAATNRFYTLIPHEFRSGQIMLIDSIEKVVAKTEMLDMLTDMAVAAKLLEEARADELSNEDPLDVTYRQLHTHIEVLPRDTDEFRMIEKYLANTHADTHSYYSLEIVEAFRVEREGEGARFEAQKALGNRKLLWHGSRVTNHAGIMRTGLRIAPPEAPSTGYMFGKGVYFADMVSKSANYCFVNQFDDPHGYILLADVALGNMYELTHSEFVTQLPDGKQSTKGLGQTHPDPTDKHVTTEGVVVPWGKGVPSGVKDSALLYNEYIVYDVSQIHLRYLLKLKFDYSRRR